MFSSLFPDNWWCPWWSQICKQDMASQFPDQNMVSYMHKVAKINAPNFVILWFRNLTFSWNEKAAVSIYFRHFVHITDHIYNSISDLAKEFHSLCIQRCCLETKIAPVKTYQLKALVKTCNFVTSFWYLRKSISSNGNSFYLLLSNQNCS